ncbi:MAG: hypothetical protein ACYCSF_13145 [Acidimicrobiales bacterium]
MADVEILTTTEQRWPGKDGPWTLRLTFAIVDDRPGVVAVELYAVDTPRIKKAVSGWPGLLIKPAATSSITTTGIRVPLAEMLSNYLATRRGRDAIISASPGLPASLRKETTSRRQQSALAKRGPGRPALYGPDHYKEVAAIYTDALRSGRTPTAAVARQKQVSQSAATKWVANARGLGLLPQTAKGKAAAWPAGPKKGRSHGK